MLGDIGRELFFAVIPDDPVELMLRIAIDNIPGCLRLALIHTHVQGCVHPIGEAPIRGVQLIGGNSQIQHDTIHMVDAKVLKLSAHITVIAPDNRHPIAEFLQSLSRCRDSVRILIDADEPSLVGKLLTNLVRMSAAAQRAVYVYSIGTDMQLFDRLMQ